MSQELPSGGWVLDTGFEVEDGDGSGSFTPSTDKADPDITAMAIQALARYRSMNVTVNGTEKNVGDAIERGLNALSAMQKSAGDFDSWGTTNVESTAQVLMALIAMGINPLKDDRFITASGNTLINGILALPCCGFGLPTCYGRFCQRYGDRSGNVCAGSLRPLSERQELYIQHERQFRSSCNIDRYS